MPHDSQDDDHLGVDSGHSSGRLWLGQLSINAKQSQNCILHIKKNKQKTQKSPLLFVLIGLSSFKIIGI